ncbi:MAG: Type 1 glutamine amidotransferase-like domain-containing protein [Actinomycetota bacterium]
MVIDSPLAHARVGLVGSGEFTEAMLEIDQEILHSIGPKPRVVILPTAAGGEDPEDWAYRGVEHFAKLGAQSVGLMVLDRLGAEDPVHIAEVERADVVYFSGGKPARLLAAIEESPLFDAMLRARANGAWIVGASAGAMVLGDWTLVHTAQDPHGTPTIWTLGLGLLQGLAVVPHYDMWMEAPELAAEIATQCTVVGIDEDSAVLLHENEARVRGRGGAVVWSESGAKRFRDRERLIYANDSHAK